MADETFVTVIRNERKGNVVLFDHQGKPMSMLAPGESTTLESWNPGTLFAPYSEVVYREDGTIETTPNTDYPAPKSRWLLTCINIDGPEPATRLIGGRLVCLPKGLTRTFELEADDPLAAYCRMEIRIVRESQPSKDWPDYSEFWDVLRDGFIDRPASELAELAGELERMATNADVVEQN